MKKQMKQLKNRYGNDMKEYEYIVLATDEIFSHMISSVICLENYYNDSIDSSFRSIFTAFKELRGDYEKYVSANPNGRDDKMELAKFRMKCRYKREEILRSFIQELKHIDNLIDYDSKVREYYDKIEKEDVETLEMQLMIYPYLLSLVRKNEESKEN